MKNMIWALIAVTIVSGMAVASTDPFVGKWKLDVQHSSYPKGTCPTQMVIEMEASGHGVRYRSDATYGNGRIAQAQYTADYNGRQAMVMGDRGLMLPVTLKRLDSRTVVASYVRGMQVVATSRRVVSSDGKRMIVTTKSADAKGKQVTTVGVYGRE